MSEMKDEGKKKYQYQEDKQAHTIYRTSKIMYLPLPIFAHIIIKQIFCPVSCFHIKLTEINCWRRLHL